MLLKMKEQLFKANADNRKNIEGLTEYLIKNLSDEREMSSTMDDFSRNKTAFKETRSMEDELSLKLQAFKKG